MRPKLTRTPAGLVIDLLPAVWIVWTRRVDDDVDYDDEGPIIRAYRQLRLVAWRITLTAEWEL